MKARASRTSAALVLASVAGAASCSSVIKGQSAGFDRGPDETKPLFDLSKYVRNRDETPPPGTSPELDVADAVPGRKKWQNFKVCPRNFKFAVAIAPLREAFRRQGDKEAHGEPPSNFATRPPDRPIEDDEKRDRAILAENDAIFGFDVTTIADRGGAAPLGSSSWSPAREAPSEAPAVDEKEDGPRPDRVGRADGTIVRHFAASGSEEPGSNEPSAALVAESASAERDRRIAEISDKEGMNFAIDSDRFQERAKKILEEFRVFENVDPIKYGDNEQSLQGLLDQADARKDDFLLVCTLRRNKVSYRGADLGPAALDNFLEVLFLANEFWSPIRREQYECDVELDAQLYDARSHHRFFDQTFEGHETLVLSTGQRGWHPLRNWLSATGLDINKEGLFADAGEFVRPGAWMDMEVKLLDSLQNALKPRLEDAKFDQATNLFHDLKDGSVAKLPPRNFALVAGISEYGPKAREKLADWAAENEHLSRDEAQKLLSQTYEGQPVKLGTRPYAEEDAKKLVKELLSRPGGLDGGAAGVEAPHLYARLGSAATIAELRACFRRIAQARAADRVFVYLNGETLVLDDPSKPDGTTKYFLPWDTDLESAEALWQKDRKAAKEWLDRNALSFDWIDACFFRDSPSDHIFLQSQHVLFVVDCAFPGQFTRERFCPGRVERTRHMLQIGLNALQGSGGDRRKPDEKKDQGKPPEKAPEKQPEKQPEKAPEKQPEKGDDEKGPRPDRVGFVNPSRFQPATVLAQSGTADVGTGVAAVGSDSLAQFTTTGFLERIAVGGPGRLVVLTAAPEERSLDIPSLKQGAFIYYFTQFLDTSKQARFDRLRSKKGFLAPSIVEYARDRLEAESRQAGQPQHVTTFGVKESDFVLVGETTR